MKPAPFEYHAPRTVAETIDILGQYGDDAKILAGGQSLVPLMNFRLARPAHIVDINRVADLAYVRPPTARLPCGALPRHYVLEQDPQVAERCPLLPHLATLIGHAQIRHRGTIGGSVAHADPAADYLPVLLALGATIRARSPRGERAVAVRDFLAGIMTTALEPDELLVETVWPASGPGTRTAWAEFAQRTGDYALAMVACTLRVSDGRVAEATIGLGSVVDRPTLVPEAAEALTRGGVDVVREAAEVAARAAHPYDNLHASARYQRHLVRVLVERAVMEAWR